MWDGVSGALGAWGSGWFGSVWVGCGDGQKEYGVYHRFVWLCHSG